MDLPLSTTQAKKAAQWFKNNFALRVTEAVKNTPFTLDVITSIFLQETAYIIVNWIDKYDTATILKYAIFDASGDIYGNRMAFPKNSKEFINTYGQAYYNNLISYSNVMRQMRGFSPKNLLYNGWGLFQYDLQFIKEDQQFWDQQQWQQFDKCLEKLLMELNRKYKIAGNVSTAIRMYNGAGKAAEQYKQNVEAFIDISQTIQPTVYYAESNAKQPDVAPLQKLIGVTTDGYFGPNTKAALLKYQANNNLPQTGVADYNFFKQTNLI